MIMRRDFDSVSDLVKDRMVRPAVAEFKLISLAAESEAEDLMPETDSEDRGLADQLPYLLGLESERLWIPGPVGEEDPVGLESEDVFGCSARRHHSHPRPNMDEMP